MYQVGDRIILTAMGDDPCPIETGSKGTISGICEYDVGEGDETQLSVKWDNGRKLVLILPLDKIVKLPPEDICPSE